MKDCDSELTKAIPTKTKTATDVIRIFNNDWVISNGIPERVLTDNEHQFVGLFFNATCVALGTKFITKTAYNPQINGQTEQYKKTFVSRLCQYNREHQDEWDTFVQHVIYA